MQLFRVQKRSVKVKGEGNKSALLSPRLVWETPELISLVDCRSEGLGHRPLFALDSLWVVGQGTALSAARSCLRPWLGSPVGTS